MKDDPAITWRRTFPECEPGTDGVALFEGRVIGRLRLLAELPRDPRPWMWERGYRRQRRASQAADPSRRNIVNLALCQLPQAVFSCLRGSQRVMPAGLPAPLDRLQCERPRPDVVREGGAE